MKQDKGPSIGSYLGSVGTEVGHLSKIVADLRLLGHRFGKDVKSLLSQSVDCERNVEIMFEEDGLDEAIASVVRYLDEEGFGMGQTIEVLRVFAQHLIYGQVAALQGVRDERAHECLERVKGDLNFDLENEGDDLAISAITEILDEAVYEDFVCEDRDSLIDIVARKLENFEGISDEFRINLMGAVIKYLVMTQCRLIECPEVETSVSFRHAAKVIKQELNSSRIRLKYSGRGRPEGEVVESADDRRLRYKEYLYAVHSLVTEFNIGRNAMSKIRPDLVNYGRSSSDLSRSGLPMEFRGVFIYLANLKVFLNGVESVDELDSSWENDFIEAHILSDSERWFMEYAANLYFPEMKSGVIRGMQACTCRKGGKDWLADLIEKKGLDYEVVAGITLGDLDERRVAAVA